MIGSLLDPSIAMTAEGMYVSHSGAMVTTVTGYDSIATTDTLVAPVATDGVANIHNAVVMEQSNPVAEYPTDIGK